MRKNSKKSRNPGVGAQGVEQELEERAFITSFLDRGTEKQVKRKKEYLDYAW
jgi:hypothetical protein